MTTEVMIKSNGPKPITISLVQNSSVVSERSLLPGESNVFNVWKHQTIAIRENENPLPEAHP